MYSADYRLPVPAAGATVDASTATSRRRVGKAEATRVSICCALYGCISTAQQLEECCFLPCAHHATILQFMPASTNLGRVIQPPADHTLFIRGILLFEQHHLSWCPGAVGSWSDKVMLWPWQAVVVVRGVPRVTAVLDRQWLLRIKLWPSMGFWVDLARRPDCCNVAAATAGEVAVARGVMVGAARTSGTCRIACVPNQSLTICQGPLAQAGWPSTTRMQA